MHHVTRGYPWIAGQRPYRARHQRQGFCVVHLGAQCGDIPGWNSDRHAAEPIPRCWFYGPR